MEEHILSRIILWYVTAKHDWQGELWKREVQVRNWSDSSSMEVSQSAETLFFSVIQSWKLTRVGSVLMFREKKYTAFKPPKRPCQTPRTPRLPQTPGGGPWCFTLQNTSAVDILPSPVIYCWWLSRLKGRCLCSGKSKRRNLLFQRIELMFGPALIENSQDSTLRAWRDSAEVCLQGFKEKYWLYSYLINCN